MNRHAARTQRRLGRTRVGETRVEVDVFGYGMAPAVVAGHRIALERAPLLRAHERMNGARDGGNHVVGLLAIEAAQAFNRRRLKTFLQRRRFGRIHDGVRQSAHARCHRQGAITHCIDLGQTAGFETAAVQQDVSARMQHMRTAFVVTNMHANAIRPGLRQPLKRRFNMRFAFADHRDLQTRMLFEQRGNGVDGDIGHFLRCHPAAYRNHRRERVHRKAKHLLQFAFAGVLAAHVVETIIACDLRVGHWIPRANVDPVDDSREFVRVALQHAFHQVPETRREDFTCVSFADGRDMIGVDNARFHQTQRAIKFDALWFRQCRNKPLRRHAERCTKRERIVALERQIVDRENAFCVHAGVLHQERREARVPVVCMDNVRLLEAANAFGQANGGR